MEGKRGAEPRAQRCGRPLPENSKTIPETSQNVYINKYTYWNIWKHLETSWYFYNIRKSFVDHSWNFYNSSWNFFKIRLPTNKI